MNKILSILAILGIVLTLNPAYANDAKHYNTEARQKIEENGREQLKNCLNNTDKTIKSCYKETKAAMKKEKKQLKYKKQLTKEQKYGTN